MKTTPSKTRNGRDPNQTEFGIVLRLAPYPFKLRAGDIIRFNNRLCRVLRVNDCAAIIVMNQPVRDFKTRFDKPVRFQPPPKLFRISSQSEVPILNGKTAKHSKAIR
jgi:hypothetical protein